MRRGGSPGSLCHRQRLRGFRVRPSARPGLPGRSDESLADEVVDEGLIEKAPPPDGEGPRPEWEELDGYRRFLLEEHAKNPPRPFEPSMLQRDAIGALFELSTVVQLRNS